MSYDRKPMVDAWNQYRQRISERPKQDLKTDDFNSFCSGWVAAMDYVKSETLRAYEDRQEKRR